MPNLSSLKSLFLHALLLAAFSSFFLTATEAGEITGTVKLKSAVRERAENTNPNRKATLKKYGLKTVRKAQSRGKGGPPKGEEIDERDFTILFLASDKDGKALKATPKSVKILQRQRRFFEHVTPMALGSRAVFINEDKFYHHIYCPDSSSLNVPEHRGEMSRKPKKLGQYALFCDIHPKMNAYLYVVPNDHFTMPKNGAFQLADIPAGNYTLKVWHPRLEPKAYSVTVKGSGATKVDVSL